MDGCIVSRISRKSYSYWLCVLIGVTSISGLLVPQSCSTYHWKQSTNETHDLPGDCQDNKSAQIDFMTMGPITTLRLDFKQKVKLRKAYVLCNSTDNKRIHLLYNSQISQTINLCPDLYPGYYYAQYMDIYGDDVVTLNMTFTFGATMNMGSCVHGHNSKHHTRQERLSSLYPQGGVYPVYCSLRLWSAQSPIQGSNLALSSDGTVCNYWRPQLGSGNEQYCKRLLDGFVDPWDAPFAFTAQNKAYLLGSWIKIVFPVTKKVAVLAWIQHNYPTMRTFLLNDNSNNFQNINCSLPLVYDSYMKWEIYEVGPYTTNSVTITIETVEFLRNDTNMIIGFYEVELYSYMPVTVPSGAVTTTKVVPSTKLTTTTAVFNRSSSMTSSTMSHISPTTTTTAPTPSQIPSTGDEDNQRTVIMISVITVIVTALALIGCLVLFILWTKRRRQSDSATKAGNNGMDNPGYSVAYSGNVSQQNVYATIDEKPQSYENIKTVGEERDGGLVATAPYSNDTDKPPYVNVMPHGYEALDKTKDNLVDNNYQEMDSSRL